MSTQDSAPNGGGKTCFHGIAWKSTKVWNEACGQCRVVEEAYDRQTRQLGGRATKRAREQDQKYAPQRAWIHDGGVRWPEALGADRRFAGSRAQRKGGGGPSIRKVHQQKSRSATWGVQRSIVAAQRKDWDREWEVVRFLREDAPERLRDRRTFSDVEWASLMVRWPGGPYARSTDAECANTLNVKKATFQENYARAYAKAIRVRNYVQKALPALLWQQNGGSAPRAYLLELLEEFHADDEKECKRERERERKARKREAETAAAARKWEAGQIRREAARLRQARKRDAERQNRTERVTRRKSF